MEGKIALGSYHWRRSVVFIINCDDIKHTDLEFLHPIFSTWSQKFPKI